MGVSREECCTEEAVLRTFKKAFALLCFVSSVFCPLTSVFRPLPSDLCPLTSAL
jgi:hypothetical protein